ncbi:MAG: restriction endonuclease subunit S [Treponema sp.]|nr:restriction endonuclease subunit S [Treponema sp.]
MAKDIKQTLTREEFFTQALVPEDEQPYKVPENWVWVKVNALVVLHRGVSYPKDAAHNEKGDNDCLIMRGGNIVEGNLNFDDNVFVNKSFVSSNQYVRRHDVIIVSSTGSTKVIGKAGISDADYSDIAFGAFLTLVRPREGFEKKLIAQFFQTDGYRNTIRTLAKGVNINNIKNEYIQNIPFPLPPLAEQWRIVECIERLFEKLDRAKDLVQNALDSFEIRKAAILHKAFAGELTAKWREKNGVGIESWEERCLSDLSVLITKGASPKWQGINYTEDKSQTLFVTSENIREGFIDLQKEKYVSNEINKIQKRSILRNGDLLLNIVGASIGRAAIYSYDRLANINQAVCLIRLNESANKKFFNYFLNSPSAFMYYSANKVDVARANLSLTDVGAIQLFIPSFLEQQEIVRILDSFIEKEQRAHELCNIIEKIDLMKKAILTRAFRGELGTNEPIEESAIGLLGGG